MHSSDFKTFSFNFFFTLYTLIIPFASPNSSQIFTTSLPTGLHILPVPTLPSLFLPATKEKKRNKTTTNTAHTNKQGVCFVLVKSSWAQSQGLWLITLWHSTGRNWFSSAQEASIANGFLARMRLCIHFYFSMLGFFFQVWTCQVNIFIHTATISVSS